MGSVLASQVSQADWISPHYIRKLDTVDGGKKFVSLEGYFNAACDENRILFDVADAAHRNEVYAALLGALYAQVKVEIYVHDSSGGQCRANRLVVLRPGI